MNALGTIAARVPARYAVASFAACLLVASGGGAAVADASPPAPFRLSGYRIFTELGNALAEKFAGIDNSTAPEFDITRISDIWFAIEPRDSAKPGYGTARDEYASQTLRPFPLAYCVVGVAVHHENSLRSIELDQLNRVFSSRIVSWRGMDDSESDRPIQRYAPPWETIESVVFRQSVGGTLWLHVRWGADSEHERRDTDEILSAVAKDRAAIGFFRLAPGMVPDRRVRVLPVGQAPHVGAVTANPEDVAAGFYAIAGRVNLYVHRNAPPEAIEFCKFATGPEGAKVLRQFGLWPEHDLAQVRARGRRSELPPGLSPDWLRNALGEPARFTIFQGDPDMPRTGRLHPLQGYSLDARVPTERREIVWVRFNGAVYSDETYTLPAVTEFHVTDRQIELLSKLATLRSLELKKAGVTNRQLETLSTHPKLQVLRLEESGVTNEAMEVIATMKDLRGLAIHSEPVDAAGLRHLTRLPKLATLELHGHGVDDAALEGVSAATSLRFLDLSGRFTDAGFAHLAPLRSLEALRVARSEAEGTGLKYVRPDAMQELAFPRISDAGLIAAGRLTNLRRLYISGPTMTDAGIAGLRTLRHLDRLSAQHTNISGAGLEHLTGLTWAELHRSQITSEGMKSFAGLVELRYLGLAGTRIEGDSLQHLRNLRNLEELNARLTKIGNDSFRHLDTLTSLERLDLVACLELDDGVAPFLGKLTGLTHLDLMGTRLTEASLPHFHGLTNLRSLRFPDHNGKIMESEEARALREALPDCVFFAYPPGFSR